MSQNDDISFRPLILAEKNYGWLRAKSILAPVLGIWYQFLVTREAKEVLTWRGESCNDKMSYRFNRILRYFPKFLNLMKNVKTYEV